MWRSMVLKEGLKLRWAFLAALVVNSGFCLKILLDIRQQMAAEHAEMVWYQMIHLQTVAQDALRQLPLLTGLALAAAQFVPELLGRRMRISLHLPVSRDAMLLYGLIVGMVHVLAVSLLVAVLTAATMLLYYPAETAWAVLRTMLPWNLAGLLAYFAGASVLLDPAWPRRLFLVFVFGTLISGLLMGHGYDWFTPVLPWLIGLIPLALLGVFESGRRFQQGGV